MKNIFHVIFAAFLVMGAAIPGKAEMYHYGTDTGNKNLRAQTAGCTPSSSFEWLDVNNVKTRINSGGDMWWDLPGGIGSQYFVPANGAATSLYAGSLWIAGVDVNQQLKCAALRFRQVGNDYYTGPLTVDGRASITADVCARWDKIFKITRDQVDEFLNNLDENGNPVEGYVIPSIIQNWPAHPTADDAGVSHYLAPFYDRDGDGEYDPNNGDYPYYDVDNVLCHKKIPTMDEEIEGSIHGSLLADQVLKGDQTLWWIFNDKGNSHTESGGQAIGIEVRAQAFAFSTNDEINNMTFYSYEIINRSTYTLTGTYFSPWTDVDLGFAKDDYVGCDVARGLGYGYNGAATDGSGETEAYGSQPPAVGIDFFQGPYMDPDGIDNPKYTFEITSTFISVDPVSGDSIFYNDTTAYNQIVDESINGVNFGNGIVDDERFGMRRFVYHNNSGDNNGDPETAPQYYNYLRGIWKNNAKMRYGGNAYTGSDVVGPECDFMFPGDSDPWNWGTRGELPGGGFNQNGVYWTEEQCKNAPDDRRFMQSAGPFTLEPGAVNYITFGVPWARANSGGPWASVELLRVVDDKCQALFDNCFKVIDGPNAPDLTIRELDQELIIYLSNSTISNNYKEGYVEFDPEIPVSRVESVTTYEEVPAFVNCVDTTILLPHNYDPTAPFDTIVCTLGGIDTVLYVPQGLDGTSYDTLYCMVGCELDTLLSNVPHVETEEILYDRFYRFEGYKVYQLVNDEVGADELDNTDKARLVFQCDVKNNVTRLVNYNYDDAIQARVPSLMVDGGDAGITHSFVITEDKFATGDNPTLVNHKTYYYMAVAYAYNNYLPYSQDDALGLQGQQKPYLEGRKNIQCYSAVPHKTVNGTVLNAAYGDMPSITRIVGMGNGYNELELSDETVNEILNKRLADSYVIDVDNHGDSSIVIIDNNPDLDELVLFGHPDYPIHYHPTYKAGFGPIAVKIIDPLNVVTTDYELWFDTLFPYYSQKVTNQPAVFGDSAARMASHWYLKDLNSDEPAVKSDTTTVYADEKMFIDRGISIMVEQPYEIGRIRIGKVLHNNDSVAVEAVLATNNGFITSSVEFDDPDHPWLDGIRDTDNAGAASFLNWIRSGSYVDTESAANNDFGAAYSTYGFGVNKPWDPSENYEKIAHSTWAPALLCSTSGQSGKTNPGPVIDDKAKTTDAFKKTTSVDIVFTSDTNLWTRCPVIEMSMDEKLAEGGAKRFCLRRHASVDRQGRSLPGNYEDQEASNDPNAPNYIAAQGMSWFPGYVIDVESGQRLNVVFGEDSYLEDLNGRDMIFNPAKLKKTTVDSDDPVIQLSDPAIARGMDNVPVMGGKHFVYIFRNDSIPVIASAPYKDFACPGYDAGARLYKTFKYIDENYSASDNFNYEFYKLVEWIGMPMGIEGEEWLPAGNDCRIRIRLTRPYAQGYGNKLRVHQDELAINDLYPKYQFSIAGNQAPTFNDPTKTEDDLNLITVVPNPYYAYDSYEGNALVNRVKIANLPEKCVVTIYTLNGNKIRQFNKDNDDPSIDWDLTNFANTPIASGFYLIHIKDFTSGSERVIKFYGAMRKVDLNTF